MELTYSFPGATREPGPLPAGFRFLSRRALLGTGDAVFTAAAARVRHWDMFRSAGLRVRGASAVAEGVDVAVGLGVGPVRLWAPCRVVWVVDEPNRYGFGYGTLPGHPERGEEAFIVDREADGRVWFEVRAISRPATWYARLGGPLNRSAQWWTAGRYVRGLRRLVAAPADPGRPNGAG